MVTMIPPANDAGTVPAAQPLGSLRTLVVEDDTLVAVRNFPRVLTYLGLEDDATSAELLDEVSTAPARVFTTADVACGQLLLVDSQFDEDPPSRDSEVVVRPFEP